MSLNMISSPAKKYTRYGLYLALLWGPAAIAEASCSSNCSMDVYFTGNYTDETCNVVINNRTNNETVLLSRVSVNTLSKNGAEAGSKPFDITLKDCPASRTITLFFNSSVSSADSLTGNLVNDVGADFSRNVQIRLRKENESQVVIDNASTGQDYIISSEGDPLTHRFTASYYANGNAAVTPGKVRAAAGVELVYK